MRTILVLLLGLLLPACTAGGSIGDPTPDDDAATDDDDAVADDDDSQPDDDDSRPDDDDSQPDDDDDDDDDANPYTGEWVGEIWFDSADVDGSFCNGYGELTVEDSGEFYSDGYCELTFSGSEVWTSFWGEMRVSGQLGGTAWTMQKSNEVERTWELSGGAVDNGELWFYWQGELLRPNGTIREYEGHGIFWEGDWGDDKDEPPPPG